MPRPSCSAATPSTAPAPTQPTRKTGNPSSTWDRKRSETAACGFAKGAKPQAAKPEKPPMPTAAELIAALDLRPLPLEGGYYRETYRSADQLPAEAWGGRFRCGKSAGTAIYYLLTPD